MRYAVALAVTSLLISGSSVFAKGCHDVVGADGSILFIAPPAVPPKPIFSPDPAYPKSALKDKIEGTVRILMVVGTDGKVRDARVVKSLRKDFDESALNAVQTWRFEPAIVCDKISAANMNVEITFRPD